MKLIKSTYDRNFYNNVVNNEKLSKAIWYWIKISFLFVLAILVSFGILIWNKMPTVINDIIPDFEIKNGLLEIDEPIYLGVNSPSGSQTYQDVEYDGSPLIIDDSFVFNEDDLKLFPSYVVATKDKIYVKGEEGLTEISYSQYDWLANSNKESLLNHLKESLPKFKDILFPVILIIVFSIGMFSVFYLGYSFVIMLILASIGLLFSSIFKKSLSFEDLLKITLYSRTLPIFLVCILIFGFNKYGNLLPTLVHIGLIGYFTYSVTKLPVETPQQVAPVGNSKPEQEVQK